MMEVIDGSSDYINLVHHYSINSALCSLVTPPRRFPKNGGKRLSYNVDETSYKTPTSNRAPPEQLSKSLPKVSASRNSPSRLSPGQMNTKGGFYAGAKFGERPSPADLPKPPNHWVKGFGVEEQSCIEMTNSLKVLLKVQS